MKKVPISVHRISGDQAHFLIPAHLDPMEVRGIIESVMEQLKLEDMATKLPTVQAKKDWQYKHDGD